MDDDTRAILADLIGEVRALRLCIERALPQYLGRAEAERLASNAQIDPDRDRRHVDAQETAAAHTPLWWNSGNPAASGSSPAGLSDADPYGCVRCAAGEPCGADTHGVSE